MKNILVCGATGQQGGAVANVLLGMKHKVFALTRKPESPAAQALAAKGAQLVKGDLLDEVMLATAMRGMDAVFVMSTPFEAGMAVETQQGVSAANAALAAGVPHFVYTSVGGAEKKTGIPHFESKRRVEEHLLSIKLPHTILRPVFFMENLAAPWLSAGLKNGTYALALPKDRPLQMIAVEDIGRFAGLVLDDPASFIGEAIELAGDERTGLETADILSRVIGRPLQYFQVPLDGVRQQSEDMAIMFEWFDKTGYSGDIAALRKKYPSVGWTDLPTWAGKHAAMLRG